MQPDAPGASRWRRSSGAAAVGSGLLTVGAIGLSVWESGLSRDSDGAHWSVALVVVAAFVITLVLGIGRQRQTSRTWAARSARGTPAWRTQSRTMIGAVVIWTVLVAATVGWDLVSFIFQSHSLPTLSFFIGEVTRYRIGRGLCFAVWLGIGGYLVAGWRTEARQ